MYVTFTGERETNGVTNSLALTEFCMEFFKKKHIRVYKRVDPSILSVRGTRYGFTNSFIIASDVDL